MPSSPSRTDASAPPSVEAARPAVEALARRTPMLSSRTISERAGGVVALKAENLQRTGSFKVRGVAAKLASLGETGCRNGVVAASAGNHGQALAAAAARGAACTARCSSPPTRRWPRWRRRAGMGATIHVGGDSVDECIKAAQARADEGGLAFVHPFDDPTVVAGQGSLGLELLEDVPDLAKVVVPVGGGGLCAGVAIAVKSARPDVEVVGVQVAACAPYPESLRRGEPVPATSALTIADGIAVKRPGELTLELLERWADDVVVVGEDETAEAMVVLMERAKLVVEGAGAVGVAALLGGQVRAGRVGHHGRGPLRRQRRRRACWPRSRAATRPRRAAGWSSSRACPTGPATSPGCSTASPARARTSSTSRTCARASTCTCARPPSSWSSRRAGTTTRTPSSPPWARPAMTPACSGEAAPAAHARATAGSGSRRPW